MSDARDNNGRFGPGNRANPHGRPRKDRSLNATIMRELNAPVTVTEDSRRKRIPKIAAAAKQMANKAAAGDMRAMKMTFDVTSRTQRESDAAPVATTLPSSDQEIVKRWLARFHLTKPEESGHDADL